MKNNRHWINRRQFVRSILGVAAGLTLLPFPGMTQGRKQIKKAIPSSGELLPVIGMGSSRTFDVEDGAEIKTRLRKVLQAFFDNGGALIDSSPMYGKAEEVIGALLRKVSNKDALFAATKVWTEGKEEGIAQMQRSMQRMGVAVFDLIQIHNLVDWATQLETLKQWKAAGKIRYIGITTSHGRFHEELESILELEDFDFVQFSYSIGNRDVEKRLLPLAKERGIATIINRPFQRGSLFKQVKGKPLPGFASEIDCTSWGQFFLKYVVSHPAVTCVIPATSKVHHMVDNMGACYGRLPDDELRLRMANTFNSL
jgi:diketogulonate reductase-like aldo/keto reductase